MKYNELRYERIDVEKRRNSMNEYLEKFSNAESVNDQINAILDVNEQNKEYHSYAAMASLNFSRDINDEDAKAEKDYYDSIGPDMIEIGDSFEKAVNQSKHKDELSKKWGEKFLTDIETSLKTFDPKIKEMLKEETNLRNEYTKLTAGAKITYEGKEYNLAGLGPFHSNEDRNVRKASYKARFNWFSENSEALDDIYDKLVKLRHKIATTLGYDNFIELGYMRMGRSDYGPNEVANFRKQIVDHVVPVVKKLVQKKKDILGLDHLYFYDGINFKEGDPKPKGSPDQLIKEAQVMYRELSNETGDFFDMMVEEELMDLVNRDGKRPGGFCTSFPKYDRQVQ